MSVAALITFGVLSAAAQAGPTFSVSYKAAADCPNQATFEAAILARAPRAHELSEHGAQVRFEADLANGAQNARLKVWLSDGTSQDREIFADGCAEAMQSMAVIAAMILEAQQPPPRAEAVRVPSPATPDPPRLAHAQPADVGPAARGEPSRPSLWLAGAVAAAVESASAPSPAFGAAAGIELGRRSTSVVEPSVRVSAILTQAPQVERQAAGDARFRLLLARAHVCGLRLASERISLRGCAVLEAGALLGQGIDARNKRSQTMPWWGAGLGGLGAVQLGGPLALEVGASGRVLGVRDEFVFSPRLRIHQVPAFAWNLSIGLVLALR